MNERILELADQAYQEYETDTIKYGANIPDEFCKKFARLIVADIHAYFDGLDTAQVISNGILKRYGVEV